MRKSKDISEITDKSMGTRLLAVLLVGILLLSGLAGCTVQDEMAEVENMLETVTVTDGFGREITIEKPVDTVAAGICTVAELLTTLGAADRIVAIDKATSTNEFLYGDIAVLPVIQSSDAHYDIDFELITELDPDIFITGVAPQDGFDNLAATLAPDIPVIALSYDTPEQVMASVEVLGRVLGCEDAAAEYVDFFQGTLDMITGRVADVPEEDKPRVYYEIMSYYTFGAGHPVFHNQVVIPGGINIAADLPQAYGAIDPEWVIEENPDVIIAMGMNYSMKGSPPVACGYDVDDPSGMEAFRETILGRSELSEVNAVKTGRVYVMQKELNTLSVIGFAYIAKWLYPDIFEDMDPQALHQEYLTRFMGIDYDLNEHGVFAYPES